MEIIIFSDYLETTLCFWRHMHPAQSEFNTMQNLTCKTISQSCVMKFSIVTMQQLPHLICLTSNSELLVAPFKLTLNYCIKSIDFEGHKQLLLFEHVSWYLIAYRAWREGFGWLASNGGALWCLKNPSPPSTYTLVDIRVECFVPFFIHFSSIPIFNWSFSDIMSSNALSSFTTFFTSHIEEISTLFWFMVIDAAHNCINGHDYDFSCLTLCNWLGITIKIYLQTLQSCGLILTVWGKPSIKKDKWDALIANGKLIGKVEITPKQIKKQWQCYICIGRKSNNYFPNAELQLKTGKLEAPPLTRKFQSVRQNCNLIWVLMNVMTLTMICKKNRMLSKINQQLQQTWQQMKTKAMTKAGK